MNKFTPFPPSFVSSVLLISCGQMTCAFIGLNSLQTIATCTAQRACLKDADGLGNWHGLQSRHLAFEASL